MGNGWKGGGQVQGFEFRVIGMKWSDGVMECWVQKERLSQHSNTPARQALKPQHSFLNAGYSTFDVYFIVYPFPSMAAT